MSFLQEAALQLCSRERPLATATLVGPRIAVTCVHVIDDEFPPYHVKVFGEPSHIEISAYRKHPKLDLAVLILSETAQVEPIHISQTRLPKNKQSHLRLAGYPRYSDHEYCELAATFSHYKESWLWHYIWNINSTFYLCGNSGGVVSDEQGDLVGMQCVVKEFPYKKTESEETTFANLLGGAISSHAILEFIHRLGLSLK